MVRWRRVRSLILSRLLDSEKDIRGDERQRKQEEDLPKKPKSPVWIIAFALASLARSLRADRRPRISAIQRILPCEVSSTFVCVLTRGRGECGGRVEVEAGLEEGCMSEAPMSNEAGGTN
jgi:hypothetical protein